MARFGIVSGLLLCFNTAYALFSSLNKEPLLFIPMMLGIPILFFGVVALNPHRRRQALATAALVGGAGCLINQSSILPQKSRVTPLPIEVGSINVPQHNVIICRVHGSVCRR